MAIKVTSSSKKQHQVHPDYKIVTVWSVEFVGNSTTSFRQVNHDTMIQLLLEEGFKPHGIPFPHPVESKSLLQVWVRE